MDGGRQVGMHGNYCSLGSSVARKKMQEAVADQEEEAVRLQLQPEEEPQEERCQG